MQLPSGKAIAKGSLHVASVGGSSGPSPRWLEPQPRTPATKESAVARRMTDGAGSIACSSNEHFEAECTDSTDLTLGP